MSSDSGKYAMCVTYNYTRALAHTESAGMQQHWASVHVCVRPFLRVGKLTSYLVSGTTI